MKQKITLLTRMMLLLCALIVGSGSVWAADIIIATATFNKTTYTDGWTVTGTGTNTNNCVVIGKDESITSPVFDLSGYDKVTVAISARRFGNLSGSKATIDVSVGGESMGTMDATKTSVSPLTAIEFEPSEGMTNVSFVFTCTNATSAGSSHGAGIGSITITGTKTSTAALSSIALSGTYPTTFHQGDEFSHEGIVVTATYEDNSTQDVTSNATFSSPDLSTTGTKEVTVSYTEGEVTKTTSYEITVEESIDYATLPFSWAGGSSADLKKVNGVTVNCNSSDYSSGNNPYLVKFSSDGHYVMVKTDGQPGKVTVGVKMLGGSNSTSIIVQGSADGETFTDIETLTISGNQNAILNLETSNTFAATDRYVRLYFNKGSGSNVGVGPITIAVPSTDPAISAEATLGLAYDATSGEIAYSIVNPVDGTTLTAASEAEWISDITVAEDKVTFTTTANEGAERTATITLTYGTLTKDVTVTQAGNPNIVDNISDITEVGTAYTVRGTVVATNARGFVIGDGTGYVYYYKNGAPTQAVGDKVTISGTTGSYGHIIQFTNTATIAEATTSNYDNTPVITAVDATAIAAYNSDYQLSDYVQFEGTLAKNNNNYEITVGSATTRISYPTDAQKTALDALLNKDVRVKGYFAGFSSSTFTVMMESVEEIVIPTLSLDPATVDPFTYEEGDVSDEQLFEVTGTNLIGDITVSVTGEYELWSETENGVSSLTLTSGDYFAVNLKESLTAGDYNGVLTIASEGATSIVIELTGTVTPYTEPSITAAETTVNVSAAEGDGTINMTYNKIDMDLVDIEFYEADGTTTATYDWIAAEIDSDNNLYYTVEANAGEVRTAYLKVYGVDNNGGDDYIYSQLITITQAAYVAPTTYSLASSIVPGKHYIIVGVKDGTYMAMGGQNTNNRVAVEVTESNGTITSAEGVNEFVLYGPDADGRYSIYDEEAPGYLYAASGSKNYLRTQASNNINGKWNITFSDGVASIVADGSSNNNVMQYNSGSTLFSCYSSASQSPVYLYEKVGEATPSVDITFAASGYATYCSPLALDLTPTDDYAAWIVTGVSGTTVNFMKITGAVPAETPFILYGQNYGGQTATLTVATGEVTQISGNMLKGTLEPTQVTTEMEINGQSYTLYGLSNGEFQKINAGTIPANKAYLPILTSEAPASDARLRIVFGGEATGIAENVIMRNVDNENVYNLNGQRVSQPKKGGLYIVNGKKALVK